MDLNERVDKLEEAQKMLNDALIIHAHLENTAAQRLDENTRMLNNHAEFMADHELRIAEHEAWSVRMEAYQERHAIKMSEFDDKLNALIAIIDRRDRGAEGRP